MTSRAIATALVALTATAGVSCGGGGDEAEAPTGYEQEITAVLSPVRGQLPAMVQQVQATRDVEQLAQPLSELQDSYEDVAAGLEEIEPPADVAELHRQAVEDHERLAEAAGMPSDAAKNGDAREVALFRLAATQFRERFLEVRGELQRRGYFIGE